MTWEFGPEKDFSKLLKYELELEEVFSRRQGLCGVCQYHRDTLPHDVLRNGLISHRGVVVSETISRINPHYLKSDWSTDLTASAKLDEMISALCRMEDPR